MNEFAAAVAAADNDDVGDDDRVTSYSRPI